MRTHSQQAESVEKQVSPSPEGELADTIKGYEVAELDAKEAALLLARQGFGGLKDIGFPDSPNA